MRKYSLEQFVNKRSAPSFSVRVWPETMSKANSRVAVVHLNFRPGSIFPVPVCTVSPGHWVNNADTQ